MAQRQLGKELNNLIQTVGRIFEADGYQLVTDDQSLFPNARPSLAALKKGRLLVCHAAVFGDTSEFLNPDEVNHIRDELDTLVSANRPGNNSRVSVVDKVALVLVPGDITIASGAGDIKWVVVEDFEELPEELDKVLG